MLKVLYGKVGALRTKVFPIEKSFNTKEEARKYAEELRLELWQDGGCPQYLETIFIKNTKEKYFMVDIVRNTAYLLSFDELYFEEIERKRF